MGIKINARRIKAAVFALLIWTCFIGEVSAQLLDDIILNTAPDGRVVAIIKLNGPVEYLRHFPEEQGQHLEIFFNILADSVSTNDPWQNYEARTSPPSDLIQSFTVSVRDLNIRPRLIVDFSRPAKYSVRIGKSRRSFVIYIQPDKAASTPSGLCPGTDCPTLLQVPGEKAALVNKQQDTINAAPAPQHEIKVAEKTGGPALPGADQVAPKIVPPTMGAATPVTTIAPVPAAAAATVITEAPLADQIKETDSQAEALMMKGRNALKINEQGLAIEAFNKVLLLPPNKYSQDAQEWVGVARENAGQTFKARLEYEAYLKMYTSGAGVDRVKQRLAKLSAVQPVHQAAENPEISREKKKFQTVSFGSVSMYYYHGASLTTVTGLPSPAGPVTDQSMLLTNINASLRSRNDQYDNRLVFQDSYNKNYLTTTSQTSPNRLSAAYFDFKDRVADFSSRIGRQSPSGGGIMGRFDGISGSYGLTPTWHAMASTGRLADYSLGSQPVFYGVGLGIVTNGQWSGSVYAINQNIEGISDRKAVGTEMRYFDAGKNAFAMLDYDTSFKVVNTALLQGTIIDASGTSYNFLVDHRKTPSMSIRNATIGSPSTISTLLNTGFTQADLETLAKLRTATSNLVQVGVSRQIKEKWQAGADIKVSNTSGLPPSGTQNPDGTTGVEGFVATTPGTGNEWGLTGQLIGNNVFSARDVSVFSLSYSKSNTITGKSFFLTNHLGITEKWATDVSLRLYRQNDILGGKETITTPTIRLTYQAKDKLSLEVDGGIDLTNNTPASGQSTKSERKYFSLGARSNF